MAEYRVYYKESVEKDFRAIPRRTTSLDRIRSLTVEPRPSGSEKLTGHERYRIRQSPYRVF